MERRKRILIVDDELIPQRFACAVLRDEYDVVTAASAEEALRTLAAASFDLVITDCEMPRMTGIELVRYLLHEQPALPCLVLSAGLNPDRQRWLEAHHVPFLFKPYRIAQIRGLVGRVLSTDGPPTERS